MYLKRLEIQGFKSFADALKLDFNKGISAVVGPNGSGKSNIADSIRWVLGEQSAKSLRGAKMEDIIFAGTQNRRPLGFAEVSITLDNSDGKIPISFGEVTITRRVYRSGESEYSINRTSCRLKDIYELFMDTGVGKEGYSIIGQGQIDRILSSKPDDRRFLFEEAVGIVKFKNRKLEAEKKLEIEKQNLIRIEDIISELQKQIQPLSIQAEKTKQYLSIKEKLKEIDLNLFLEEADLLKNELTSLAESFSINEEQLLSQKNFQVEQKQEYAHIREALDQVEEKLFQIQNNISDIKTSIQKSEGNHKVILQEIHHFNLDIERLQNECSKIESKITYLDEEKIKLSAKKNGLSLELKSKKQALEEEEKQFHELNQFLLSSETEIENFKSDIIEKMNQASDIKNSVQKMNGTLEQIESRRSQIQIEKLRIESQYKDQQIHLKALDKIAKDKEDSKQNLQEDIDKLVNSNAELIRIANQKIGKLNTLTERMHAVKSRQQILEQMEKEHEGFNKSVKNILRLKQESSHTWKGICGVVAELIQVPKGYETALEVALGSSMQNIVTNTEEVSKKVIEYLKRNQLGRATFLPLSAIKGREMGKEKEGILKEDGMLGIASSIIQYDPMYRDIFSYLLGRVLIVKNLDFGIAIAKKYHHRYKIVTLDGDVLNAGGSMTGGSIYQKSSGFFSRTRELRELTKELDEIVNQLDEAKKDLKSQEEIKNKNALTIEDKKKMLQEIHMESISKSHEMQQCRELILQIEDKKKQFGLEEEQLKLQYDDTFDHLAQKKEILRSIETEIEDIHSKVEAHQSQLLSERTSKETLVENITNIRIQISSLEQNDQHIRENIKRLENEIKTLSDEKKQKQEEIRTFFEQIKLKEDEIQKNQSEVESLQGSLEEKLTIQETLQKAKKQSLAKQQEYEDHMDKTTKNIELIQQEIHRIENKTTKSKLEQENLYNHIWEEYEETYNSALKSKADLGSLSEMKRQASEYKNQIKNLGNINLDAVEEYEKVKERYEFLSSQKDDILYAEQKLQNIIQELTASMEKQFIDNFAVISANFNEVFVELFGGGQGYLQLVDEEHVLESGIEIIAQPPGKKLQNMLLLSGGERALTAIALLFSILKMKPSPFCILDEIEAALDDANVNRFAQYLKRFDHSTQFIVITHRKGTMEAADTLYGVTMQEQGISKLLSVKLSDVEDSEEAS